MQSIKKAKFRVGQSVMFHDQLLCVFAVQQHGMGECGCCFGEIYFLYRVSGILWIAEDQLKELPN